MKSTPDFLEFRPVQNETKMKTIRDFDSFFDFFMFHTKRWLCTKKNSKAWNFGPLALGEFPKYKEKLKQPSYQERWEQNSLGNKLMNFIFCLKMENQTT
jgi:hypothetical protein